jgi:hypothetical protein
MELLLFIAVLWALAMLAVPFGADTRPTLVSEEERLAQYGVTWELGGWRVEERRRVAAYERLLSQLRSTTPTARVRLADVLRRGAVRVLRRAAARLDEGQASHDGLVREPLQSL